MRKITVITGSRADYGLLKVVNLIFTKGQKHKIEPNSYWHSFI